MADIDDRWHVSTGGEPACREHNLTPSAAHGTGKRWQARWRDPAGRQRKVNFARKADAASHLAAVKSEMDKGHYVDRARGKITLIDYARTVWLPAQLHLAPGTVTRYRRELNRQIGPLVGDRQIGSLRKSDVESFVTTLSHRVSDGTLSPWTVRTVFGTLRTILSHALADDVISTHPCRGVKLPTTTKRPFPNLTPQTVLALAEEIDPRYRVCVFEGACAGLRAGEALGLAEPYVLFLNRRIEVEQQDLDGEITTRLKSKTSRRKIPADDILRNEITAHMRRFPDRGEHRLIVTDRHGQPVKYHDFNRAWDAARKAVGMPTLRFHDLRHFYATVLIAAGYSPKVIQERMGHASIQETMDTYGHLFPEDQEHAGRGALDNAFRSCAPDVPSAESI